MPETIDFEPETQPQIDFQPERLNFVPDPPPKFSSETEKALAETPRSGPWMRGLAETIGKGLDIAKEGALQVFPQEMVAKVFGGTTTPDATPPLVSPATAKAFIGELPAWAGGNTQFAKGATDALAGAVSSFSAPGTLASLPAFLVPGVAETFALNTFADLPRQYDHLKQTIQQYGFFSKETGAAATEAGINDLMGFLAAKGGTAERFRTTQRDINAAPVRPATESEGVPAAPSADARSETDTAPPAPARSEGSQGADTRTASSPRQSEVSPTEDLQSGSNPQPQSDINPVPTETASAEMINAVRTSTGKILGYNIEHGDALSQLAENHDFVQGESVGWVLPKETKAATDATFISTNDVQKVNGDFDAAFKAKIAGKVESPPEFLEGSARPEEPIGNDWTTATEEVPRTASEDRLPASVQSDLQAPERPGAQPEVLPPVQDQAPVPRSEPRLLPGEQQGDLISSTQAEDFALVGEKGTDFAAQQARTEAAAQRAEEARLKAESEQALLDDFAEHQARGGDELLDAVNGGGGLPALSSKIAGVLRGELENIRQEYKNPARKERIRYSDIFKKDAPEIDRLTQYLRSRGFEVSTPGETLDLIRDRIRTGRRVYGDEARGLENTGLHLRERAGEAGYTTLIPDAVEFGRRVFGKGMDFAKWSAEMVRHLGEKIKEHLKTIWNAVKSQGDERGSIGGNIGLKISGKRNDLNAATTARSAKLQKSFADAERAQKEIGKIAPTERRQGAISVYAEAKGDLNTLKTWAAAAKGKEFKKAATDAQTLSPKEIALAQKARQTFDVLESRGNRYDVLTGHKENYIPHVWDVSKRFTGIGSSKLKDRFKFNKARTFETFFDGDQAGFKPKTLAIGKLLPAYLHEMNTVIADRQFVQDASSGVSKEGTPLTIPSGNARQVEATEYVVSPTPKFSKSVYDTMADAQAALLPGQTIQPRRASTTFVNPRGFAKAVDATGHPIDQSAYTVANQPALSNWRWVGKDAAGNTTLFKGDLKVHPELAKRLHAMLGESGLRRYYNEPGTGLSVIPKAIAKGLDTAQSVMKREMFSLLAPFHQVQEGAHAVGHLVNPFFGMEDMSRTTAAHMDAMQSGLMLKPEKASGAGYLEGVGGQNSFISQITRKYGAVPGRMIANVIDGYQRYLFHQYIPALKFKTYTHIVARNMKRYANELASGEVTAGDVKMLSAEQTNAAFGHLNHALLDRSPNVQHFLQLTLLAPDFLEARGRFVAQAIKPSKAGIEQFRAIATLAAIQAGSAYILSQLIPDGHWDEKHPFELRVGNRVYTLRSVPEDLFRLLFSGPDVRREFVSARINPVLQKGIQAETGRNYRGEKVTQLDTIEELLANYIPITARQIPGVRELTETGRNSPTTPLEQLSGSLGLKISRYSPITKTYQLATEWKKANGIPLETGSYPVSKYQQLRYALEDADMDKAKLEYKKLLDSGMKKDKIMSGFKESINHAFTGSKKTDEQFSKSLDGDSKDIFNAAVQRRKDILRKFGFLH